ncbi:hypothetical protein HETIRDRAFT_412194 [Heterobasidion irregulare TC 32-1]|uniref:Uncharacterized protein n=1 Tax=Heterobasidion irregulare (strain TC 32-1) TaxID=747525 RepID=W4JRW3_HETIT|nr:uncharacterized protein HETIRDRAFT_412194 [Heterobasidion irregulare TC 32-1]ETW75835.1 hypothetical protein HETIRDRAFT_412194 [Heterobasidion irregulare TC 32-1]
MVTFMVAVVPRVSRRGGAVTSPAVVVVWTGIPISVSLSFPVPITHPTSISVPISVSVPTRSNARVPTICHRLPTVSRLPMVDILSSMLLSRGWQSRT